MAIVQNKAAAAPVDPHYFSDDDQWDLDNAHGVKKTVTTSTLLITPPIGCPSCLVSPDADIVLNTAGNAAVDDGTGYFVPGGTEDEVPVKGGVPVYALAPGGTATVYATPLKARA